MRALRTFAAGSGSTAFSFEPQQCPGETAITAYKTKTRKKKLIGLQFRCGRDEWLDPIEHRSDGDWSDENEFQCPGQSFIQKILFKKDNDKFLKIGAQCKNGDFFVYISVTLYSRMDSPGATGE